MPVVGLQTRLAELAPPRLPVPPGGDPAADVHVGVQPEHRVQVLAHVGLWELRATEGGHGGADPEHRHAVEERSAAALIPAYESVTTRFAAWLANR
ncbi:hypothetical protein GCM10023350_34360 [Nocardioides endophyticus]|uniref:Uncharacterized protein n=1 Tax=Nocardioides endophyticus TaxID=1353775 RepID=A0ABP8Z5N9_9ACTN